MQLLSLYSSSLVRRPLLTKMGVSSALFGFTSYINFKIQGRPNTPTTILRASTFGALIAAPSLHLWYIKLLPILSKSSLAQKILIDQLIFAPYLTSLILGLRYINKGCKLDHAKKKVSVKLKRSMRKHWSVWPFLQLVNFTIIPTHF